MKRYSYSQAAGMTRSTNGAFVLRSDATAKLAALEAERDRLIMAVAYYERLAFDNARERDRLRDRLGEANTVVRHLMLSADANWELERMGHDWADACEEARAFLAQKEPSDGE